MRFIRMVVSAVIASLSPEMVTAQGVVSNHIPASTAGTYTATNATTAFVAPSSGRVCLNGAACTVYAVSDGSNITIVGGYLVAPATIYSPAAGNLALSTQNASAGFNFTAGASVTTPLDLATGVTHIYQLSSRGAPIHPQRCDSTASPGNATCNEAAGRASIAGSAAAVTITNSQVATTSVVHAILQANDATCTSIKSIAPGSGSFVITANAACTGATAVGWVIASK